MDDWLSYRLQDFLLFDRTVYLRQFERYNEWLGPFRFSGTVAGLWILFSIFSRSRTHIIFSLILVCSGWIICSYVFLWQLFRPINWTIDYAILLPVLQIILLLAAASGTHTTTPGNDSGRGWYGLTCILLAFFITIAPWLFGQAIEFWPVILLTPESLALASIGLILTTRTPIWYSAPSITWLIYNGLIGFSLDLSAWFFPLLVTLLFVPVKISDWKARILTDLE